MQSVDSIDTRTNYGFVSYIKSCSKHARCILITITYAKIVEKPHKVFCVDLHVKLSDFMKSKTIK